MYSSFPSLRCFSPHFPGFVPFFLPLLFHTPLLAATSPTLERRHRALRLISDITSTPYVVRTYGMWLSSMLQRDTGHSPSPTTSLCFRTPQRTPHRSRLHVKIQKLQHADLWLRDHQALARLMLVHDLPPLMALSLFPPSLESPFLEYFVTHMSFLLS